jgi:hypothetical protein
MKNELEAFSCLLHLFSRLVDHQQGDPIFSENEWINDAQVLSIKLFRHLCCIRTLVDGTTVVFDDDTEIGFIDHGSLIVVARAALETYLVFYYIYCCGDSALAQFRHSSWELGGLTERQQFHVSLEEHRTLVARELKKIETLRGRLRASPHLNSYTAKQRQRLLEGDWRIGISWTQLGEKAGFHRRYFDDTYRYLCGYSHASYASALQIGQALDIEDQNTLSRAIFTVAVVLMAHFAFTYSEAFPRSMPILESDHESKRLAECWRFGPADMAAKYDS